MRVIEPWVAAPLQGFLDESGARLTLLMTSAGHHPPLLRRANGAVMQVPLRPGRLLGYDEPDLHLVEARLTLAPGDLLFFFTDGVLEARAPDHHEQFGPERLRAAVADITGTMPLSRGADLIKQHLSRFTETKELRDDVTLLLLRRGP